MSSTVENLFMIVCVTEFILGVFGNGFIVLINSKDWIRNGKISLTDFIITCLAISTMCFLWTALIVTSFHTFAENTFFSKCLLTSFAILWTASDYFCSACTTCLSVFYFFKISNFSNPVFLWMKWRIHKVLIMIVLGAIIYLCISLIFMETLTNFVIQEQVIMKKNLTSNFLPTLYNFLTYYILHNMILIILFLVSLTSFLFLILSLLRHTRQMKLQGIYSKGISTEAHVRAMKTMISFLILFIMYFFSNLIIMLTSTIVHSVGAKIFGHVLIFLYPSGYPFLLILWNNKLKQASLCVLRKARGVREEIIPHCWKHA